MKERGGGIWKWREEGVNRGFRCRQGKEGSRRGGGGSWGFKAGQGRHRIGSRNENIVFTLVRTRLSRFGRWGRQCVSTLLTTKLSTRQVVTGGLKFP